ncbi:MAG: MucB/RseB C-terminal domain-containing protein [Porticoccaceae bacterium]
MPVQAMDSLSSTQTMLKKMAMSARNLSYVGTATYEQSGVMRSVKIIHTVRNGLEVERLEYLDGPRHEIIRQGNPVDCERVSDLLIKGEVLPGAGLDPEQGHAHLEDYYDYSIRGNNRVAGRKVVQVFLQPKDRYRYGHLLSLDKKTGLLLQSMLINRKGNIMERFQFTAIDIGAVIDESALQPKTGQHIVARADLSPCGFAGQVKDQQASKFHDSPDPAITPISTSTNAPASASTIASTIEASWQVAWVPPGFVLADFSTDAARGAQEMMYTDGISAFSVFIDPDNTLQGSNIEARRGATVAYMAKSIKDEKRYTICVVGELPMQTARLVAEAVVLHSEPDHGDMAQ